MTVRGLQEFLHEKNVLRRHALKELKGVVLPIDSAHWILSLFQQILNPQKKGSSTAFLSAALGAWPALGCAAQRDLQCLVAAGARPVLVLPGFDLPAIQQQASSATADVIKQRFASVARAACGANATRAWKLYYEGDDDDSSSSTGSKDDAAAAAEGKKKQEEGQKAEKEKQPQPQPQQKDAAAAAAEEKEKQRAAQAEQAQAQAQAQLASQQMLQYCMMAWSMASFSGTLGFGSAGSSLGGSGAGVHGSPSSPSSQPNSPSRSVGGVQLLPPGCALAAVPQLQECLAGAARACGVPVVRAPRLSMAQAAHMAAAQHPAPGSPVLSGPEAAMFGAQRVVTSIDAEKATFEWFDVGELLSQSGASHDQFVDACVLAGTDVTETFPFVPPRSSFRTALQLVQSHHTGKGVLVDLMNEPNVERTTAEHMKSFMRSNALMRHHPVFTSLGACEPLQRESSPEDLSDIVGPALPNELVFLVFCGALSPRLANAVVTGSLTENPPLADTEELRNLVTELVDLRGKTLGILTSSLNKQFQHTLVSYTRWFDGQEQPAPTQLQHAGEQPRPDIRTMDEERIKEELARQKRSTVDLAFVLEAQAHRQDAAKPSADAAGDAACLIDYIAPEAVECITTPNAALVYTLTQGLLMMDDISSETGRLTEVGAVLAESLGANSIESPDQLLIALELLHAGYLSAEPLKAIPAVPSPHYYDAPPSSREFRLLTRVFSLLPMRLTGGLWSGPVDYDLAAFHCIVGSFCNALRELYESLLASFVLRKRLSLKMRDYDGLSRGLPFGVERNTGLGLAMRELLIITAEAKKQPAPLEQQLAARLGDAPADLMGDFARGVRFWCDVRHMAHLLSSAGLVDASVAADFDSAHSHLSSALSSIPALSKALGPST